MESPRRSGSLSGNNTTTPDCNGKRSPSSDKPRSLKRQKLVDEKPAAKDGDQTVEEETSNQSNTQPPPPPVAEGSTPDASFSGWMYHNCRFKSPWCRFLSQSAMSLSLDVYSSCFSIGSCESSTFNLNDPALGASLYKITRIQRQGNVVAVLDILETGAPVLINGIAADNNVSHVLHSGDEVVIGILRSHAYIYQQMSNVALEASGEQVPAWEFLQLERKARDPSLVSVTASLKSLQQELSRRKSSSKSCQAPEKPATSMVQVDGMEGIFSANNQIDKAAGTVSSHNQDSKMEILDEENELTRNSQLASTSGNDLRSAILRQDIHACIFDGESLEVSFENFPFYLSEYTKIVLIAASRLHLKQKEYAKYASDLVILNPRILFSGPPGSEIYQEMLAKALANYFKAKLLIFDSHAFLVALTAKEIESRKHGMASENSCKLPRQSLELIDRGKSSDLSTAGEGDASSRSPAASSGPYSQPKLEPKTLPRSFGNPVNRTLKKGDRVRFFDAELYPGTSTLRGPPNGIKGKVILVFDENPSAKVGVRFDEPIPDGVNLGELCEMGHGFFCNATNLLFERPGSEIDKLLVNILFEVVHSESRTCPFILFLKDAEKFVVGDYDSYSAFKSGLEYLPENVIVIGSQAHSDNHIEKSHPGGPSFTEFGRREPVLSDVPFRDIGQPHERGKEVPKATKLLTELYRNKVTIHVPQDENLLTFWKHQSDRDAETLKMKANFNNLRMVLERCGLECEDIETLCMKDLTLQTDSAKKIIGLALSDHLSRNPDADPDTRVSLSRDSIGFGMRVLQGLLNDSKTSLKDIVTENEFEKRLLNDVIPASDIDVAFDDIGALDDVKDTLKELVMLPLNRPELFSKGKVTKPCKGILLYGPPGTGKSMLAKAVAKEAGANFINISMSSLTSKWFGEGEKYVKAVFSLSRKLSPCVIFVDEVDSMLGRGGKEAMQKVKNEFVINWDGLRTKEVERVVVLAATNRPFDLDEAVIRRFPRRLMVGLPDALNRAKILKVLLAEDDLSPDLDINEVASMTNGYPGRDLMNLCVTAAHRLIKETLEKEKNERDAALAEGKVSPARRGSSDFRALNMEDFRYAYERVPASESSESENMQELQHWNELYGEAGSRKMKSLSYYL